MKETFRPVSVVHPALDNRTPQAPPEEPGPTSDRPVAKPAAKQPNTAAGITPEKETSAARDPGSPASGANRRGRNEYRVVRVEAGSLDEDGSHPIEELLRQWSGKGYHLAAVVPGKGPGLFSSAGPHFFIFARDSAA